MKYEVIRQFARDLRKRETVAENFFWKKVRDKHF
jgi:very-short-patch-repair endonuclease